jgi:uncharacterized protein YbaR (Trm112 family)
VPQQHLKRASGLARTAGAVVRDLAAIARERRRHRPAPPAGGLVLDVGAGESPHPRADLVVDKYVVDDFERGAPLDLARPVVVADGEALPFADGAFAYVIASHVLEHAIDPTRFAAELSRIAAAGFVQVPSRDAELVYGWPFHPWWIERRGDTLLFRPKEIDAPPGGRVMHDAYAESPLTRLGWAAHRSRWHHSLHWTGRIDVEVDGERRFHEQARLDLERTVAELDRAAAAGRVAALDDRLRAVLRCPACGGALTWDAARVACASCSCAYPVAGGVPILLAEAASTADRPPAVAH